MILGVADGVSQLEEFGMDASQLPRELLRICEDLGMNQLIPDRQVNPQEAYQGPVSLLKEAYEETESMGSTTILLAVLDNSTKIHGKLHPMVAVLTIGDCELLMLRRLDGRQSPLQAVFHTEMQRIDGHSQTPLQLARVDDRVDPDFDEELALEVIERGSAVHCVSAYEGDIIILGSDGIFDNLFLEEIVDIVNESLPAPKAGSFVATQPSLLSLLAKRLVDEAHSKSEVGRHGLPDTPIGLGGKMDDTSVVVGEVVEWTRAHSEVWAQVRKQHQWRGLVSCLELSSEKPWPGGGHAVIGTHETNGCVPIFSRSVRDKRSSCMAKGEKLKRVQWCSHCLFGAPLSGSHFVLLHQDAKHNAASHWSAKQLFQERRKAAQQLGGIKTSRF
ncbi:unnamed protein product [Symbiodinium sp. CCMP2592]|nr:unnamed protein product [Symbiodinium sp. CCMP2592]